MAVWDPEVNPSFGAGIPYAIILFYILFYFILFYYLNYIDFQR
jgi:hypothetical protein